ncbi:MAG: fasciclin domain-containing protein [Methanothrix sp.]|nr:fasciclin domain-containing protein [Methanothrix sp.]
MIKKAAPYALLVSATLLVGVCMGASNSMDTSPGGKNIVDTAIAAGNFKTLVAALQAAGLEDTLKGDGPFTVFAPTDAAFAKIPKDQLNALMANKTQLTALLTYHVVPGKVMSTELKNGMMIKTVLAENLIISLANGGVMVNDAKVVQADIVCSNGVIHVIDTVLIPEVLSTTANINLSKSNINRIKTNSTDTTKSIAVSDSGVVSRPAPIKPIKSK